MKKIFNRVGLVMLVVVISLIISPSKEEQEADRISEIKRLEKEIAKLSPLQVEENAYRYNRLTQLDPENKSYILKRDMFEKREGMASVCREKGREQDRASLSDPSTYEGIESARSDAWLSDHVFVTGSSFKGSNALKKIFVFRSEYECRLTRDGVRIKRNYIKLS